MNTTISDHEENTQTMRESRQHLLELARDLDRFGRQTQQFLCQQLEQLELAIDEFEREKAAWRRQLRRESTQLVRQREEVQRILNQSTSTPSGTRSAKLVFGRDEAKTAARKSGETPLRFLLQPGSASSIQVGLLLFELSKLNHDMGGRGLRFEVTAVRVPGRRLLSRKTGIESNGEIMELTAHSIVPLAARGSHVAMDVDITDRIENWIIFKSHLIQSSLVSTELTTVFNKGAAVQQDHSVRSIIHEATQRVDDARLRDLDEPGHSSSSLFANTAIDSVQQQMERLEGCYERLQNDCGLHVHVEVTSRV